MAITNEQQQNIIALTVGLFNAAPGADYLTELSEVFEANGNSYAALTDFIVSTPAFNAQYAGRVTVENKVATALNLLGVPAEGEAREEATAYFLERAEAGASEAEILLEAVQFLQGDVAEKYADIKAAFENKIEVATFYSVEQQQSSTNLEELKSVVANVTSDPATVEEAEDAIIGGTGQTFTLTTGVDAGTNFTGGAGNDTFVGTWSEAGTGGGTFGGTLNLGDNFDGQGGSDTLDLTVSNTQSGPAATTTVTGFTAANVEKVFVTAFGAAAGNTTTFDATTTRAGEEFWNDGSARNVTFDNIQQNAAVGVTGNTVADTTATFLDSVVTGSSDTGTVALNNAGTATAGGNVTLNGDTTAAAGFETVNVVSSGNAASRIGTLQSGTNVIEDVNLSGSASVRIDSVNSSALDGVNASGLTGGASANINAATSTQTDLAITGSANNDRFVINGTTANATNTFNLNGGEGKDTLAISTGIAFTQAASATLVSTVNKATSFEVLEATNAATRAVKANDFTGINEFSFTAVGATTLALTGVETADAFVIGANQTGAAGLAGGPTPGTNAVTITGANAGQTANLDLGSAAGSVAVTGGVADNNAAADAAAAISFGGGVSTLTITSNGAAANTITGGAGNTAGDAAVAIDNGTSVQSVVIDGAQALTIAGGAAGGATAARDGFSNSVNVNAADLTGKLTIAGSSQADTIVVGSGGSEVRSTAGNDTITLGAGNDTYALRALTDSLTAVTDDTAILNSVDVINSWGTGSDKINLSSVDVATGTGFTSAEFVAQNVVQAAVDAVGPTSLLQASQAAAANLGADKVGAFQYDGDTYVLAQDGNAAFASTDALVQIVGEHTLGAENFVFA